MVIWVGRLLCHIRQPLPQHDQLVVIYVSYLAYGVTEYFNCNTFTQICSEGKSSPINKSLGTIPCSTFPFRTVAYRFASSAICDPIWMGDGRCCDVAMPGPSIQIDFADPEENYGSTNTTYHRG